MPKPQLLEVFPNPYADRDYEIHMDCPEFTSLCPLGGIEGDASDLTALEGGAPDSSSICGAFAMMGSSTSARSIEFWMT